MLLAQTILALSVVALAVAALSFKLYQSLKSSSCCGSCGCDIISGKAQKKPLKKRNSTPAPTTSKR